MVALTRLLDQLRRGAESCRRQAKETWRCSSGTTLELAFAAGLTGRAGATTPESAQGLAWASAGGVEEGGEGAADAPQPPNLDDSRLGRLLGRKSGGQDGVMGSISRRLRALRNGSQFNDIPTDEPEEPAGPRPMAVNAALIFTAGPRAGDVVALENRRLALDRDALQRTDSDAVEVVASIWAQGSRFMLRHRGTMMVAGSRPALPVIALDDGDELAWGPHRAQFRIEEAASEQP